MKLITTLLFTFFVSTVYSQPQCACASDTTLSERVSCKPIVFKNKAKLYWQFNCDSSWLTFEGKNKIKRILYSTTDVASTERDGDSYAAEYKTTFLVQHNWISGCCDTPSFILYSKETGKIKSQPGSLIFYSDNPRYPIIVGFHNEDYDSLSLFNVDDGKRFWVPLPKGRIKSTIAILRREEHEFPEFLFEPTQHRSMLMLKYRFKRRKDRNVTHFATIKLDLKRYCK